MGWSNVEPQRSQATSGRLLSNRLDGRLGVRLPVSCEKIASGLAESYWNPANEGKGSLVSGRITRAKRSRALAAR